MALFRKMSVSCDGHYRMSIQMRDGMDGFCRISRKTKLRKYWMPWSMTARIRK